jgi:flagellar biosynthesis/type III secretory pathway protein FliH
MTNGRQPHVKARLLNKQEFQSLLGQDLSVAAIANSIIGDAKRIADQIFEIAEEEEKKKKAWIETEAHAELERLVNDALETRRAEVLSSVLDEAARIRGEFDAMLPALMDMLEEMLRKLLGAFDARTLLARLVQQGARDIAPLEGLALRVHPDAMQAVEEARVAFPEKFSAISELLTDHKLGPDQVILENKGGYIEVDMEAQLSQVMKQLRDAGGQGTGGQGAGDD